MAARELRNLEARRRALKMSRKALADRTGLSAPTLERILTGDANPTLETLAALSSALGVEFRIANQSVELKDLCSASQFRKKAAKQKALQLVRLVQGTSALESQSVNKADERDMIEQTTCALLAGTSRKLWAS